MGNIHSDGTNQYLYDGEDRVCAVSSETVPSMVTMTGYLYDADGNRVAKGTITSMSCNPATNGFTITENYVLGTGGEELSMIDGNNNWQRTNVYAGGRLIGTYDMVGGSPALHFHLSDPLGTRRMQLSGMLANLGQPEIDLESLPYGDQTTSLPSPYAATSSESSFLGATPLFFTGKERDSESGNDYFGARYFSSAVGRFLSPDDGTDQDAANPQNMNRYSYVHNNPLRFNDPFGHSTQTANNGDVLAVYNDGDLGVYQHTDIDNLADWDIKAGFR